MAGVILDHVEGRLKGMSKDQRKAFLDGVRLAFIAAAYEPGIFARSATAGIVRLERDAVQIFKGNPPESP